MIDKTLTKHIVIGGGSGFVGTALSAALRRRGDRVTVISRCPGPGRITWDEVRTTGLLRCDGVINLAGKHILDMRRAWTNAYREEVISSRVETTKLLVRAINQHPQPPAVFISTAGKCSYGSQALERTSQYEKMDEHSAPIGIDYPAEVVSQWEAAALGIDCQRVRHVQLRLGVVLGTNRVPTSLGEHAGSVLEDPSDEVSSKQKTFTEFGIFPLFHMLFKRGWCMNLGSGVQPFPWVHIEDVVGIYLSAIDNASMHKIYNAVAPGIVSNQKFSTQLANKLGKRVWGSIPAWLINAVVGRDRSSILLNGQRVSPTRTIEYGYHFKYPHLDTCLDDLLNLSTPGARA